MSLSEEVALAMDGLEAGLHVHHIATFPVRECSGRDDVQVVLNDPQLKDFDYIPVRDGQIIGVLERSHRAVITGQVERHCVRLDDSLIVAAETPLVRFLPLLENQPYRLVMRQGKIDGIVTASDLNRLPVRLHLFTRIAHFEMRLSSLILRRCPDDESALKLLDEGARKKVRKRLADQQRHRLNPSVVVLMDLAHKCKAAAAAYEGELGPEFTAEMRELTNLRNTVAHFRALMEGRRSIAKFYGRLRLLDKWTERLDKISARQRSIGVSVGR